MVVAPTIPGAKNATVSGGDGNVATGSAASVGGGADNFSGGDDAAVCGGSNNSAGWVGENPGGGVGNYAIVGGGSSNAATGNYAMIGGGSGNVAMGNYATVPGGSANFALGANSFAAGENAWARDNGSFVWSDGTPGDAFSAGPNTFVARASGGFQFYVAGGFVSILPNGTLNVPVLSVSGGTDVAEPFKTSHAKIPAGSVVVIDEAHPGQLKLSERSYDTRVAGVVSGANGIHPGIQMQQQGLLAGGQSVSLTGRVYVRADASNSAIHPGDLLTTSSIPGYAMAVTDHARAQNAILGKAMTGLRKGKGMILMLVTLQ